jgi:hypothetical protein
VKRILAIVGICAVACASAPEAADGDGMGSVQVSADADFQRVQGRWSELIYAADPGELVIDLAPGTYTKSLQLGDVKGGVHVRIRGVGGPAVFDGASLSVDARSLVLENVVLTGWTLDSPVLQVKVRESLVLDHVAVADNVRHTTAKRPGPLVRITSSYKTGARPVTIRDSWFVGNGPAPDGSTLIGASGVKPDQISTLTLERVVFAANAFPELLAPGLCDAVDVKDSVVVASGGFGFAMNGTTRWSFAKSRLAAEPLVRANPKLDAATFPAPTVDGEVAPAREADRAALGDAPLSAATPDVAAVAAALFR